MGAAARCRYWVRRGAVGALPAHALLGMQQDRIIWTGIADQVDTLQAEFLRFCAQHDLPVPVAGDKGESAIVELVFAALFGESQDLQHWQQLTSMLQLLGTDFQREVWQALMTIPSGETRSYRQLAVQLGRPKAQRALANACGANPLSVIIPCHRVVRSDGELGGYHWGVDYKRELLRREAALSDASTWKPARVLKL